MARIYAEESDEDTVDQLLTTLAFGKFLSATESGQKPALYERFLLAVRFECGPILTVIIEIREQRKNTYSLTHKKGLSDVTDHTSCACALIR